MCGKCRQMFTMKSNPKEICLKTVKVVKDASVKDNSMAEIYQSNATQQALLRREADGSFSRITNFVKCRDFLVDTFSFAKENRDFNIYSFGFSGSKMQPDWTGVYIMMKFNDSASRENFLKRVKFIHAIEKTNGYNTTELMEVEGEKSLVAIGDVRWLQNCLSFSLYSLLLRCMCYNFDADGKDWITPFTKKTASDAKYIASVPRATLDKVLQDLTTIQTKTFCGFNPKKDETHVIHHNSGFISVFGWHSEINADTVKTNNHWKEMEKRGLETCVGQKAA
jgi:hypothetical protein